MLLIFSDLPNCAGLLSRQFICCIHVFQHPGTRLLGRTSEYIPDCHNLVRIYLEIEWRTEVEWVPWTKYHYSPFLHVQAREMLQLYLRSRWLKLKYANKSWFVFRANRRVSCLLGYIYIYIYICYIMYVHVCLSWTGSWTTRRGFWFVVETPAHDQAIPRCWKPFNNGLGPLTNPRGKKKWAASEIKGQAAVTYSPSLGDSRPRATLIHMRWRTDWLGGPERKKRSRGVENHGFCSPAGVHVTIWGRGGAGQGGSVLICTCIYLIYSYSGAEYILNELILRSARPGPHETEPMLGMF